MKRERTSAFDRDEDYSNASGSSYQDKKGWYRLDATYNKLSDGSYIKNGDVFYNYATLKDSHTMKIQFHGKDFYVGTYIMRSVSPHTRVVDKGQVVSAHIGQDNKEWFKDANNVNKYYATKPFSIKKFFVNGSDTIAYIKRGDVIWGNAVWAGGIMPIDGLTTMTMSDWAIHRAKYIPCLVMYSNRHYLAGLDKSYLSESPIVISKV
jgi:hypothetical protein